MNINYFLSSKNKLHKILSYLHEIKLNYFEMEIKEENGNIITCDYIKNNIEEFEDKICEIELTIKYLNELIFNNCEHDFVEDLIDINPDKSQRIIYCKICEYTKEYGFYK